MPPLWKLSGVHWTNWYLAFKSVSRRNSKTRVTRLCIIDYLLKMSIRRLLLLNSELLFWRVLLVQRHGFRGSPVAAQFGGAPEPQRSAVGTELLNLGETPGNGRALG